MRRILIPIIIILALLAGGGWWFYGRSAAASDQHTFSGTIEADEVDITSEVSGLVERLQIDDGSQVKAGDTLLTLNTDLLNAQLAQARAGQQNAEANLALLKAGAREEDIQQAQAQLTQAQAVREGAAQALKNAQASTVITQTQVQTSGAARSYQDAVANLKNPQEIQTQVVAAQTVRDAAQTALNQATINAQSTRDRLSLAKTQAESQMQQATTALTQAQSRYAQSKTNWEYVQEHGNDPIVPTVKDSSGKSHDNKVSDATRENYYNTFVQAEAAMHQSEQVVAAAQTSYDSARQAEVTGVQTVDEQTKAAETALANSEANLAHVKSIQANPQQLRAAADAALAQLNSLRTGVDAARVQYQTGVDNAQAQLASADAAVSQAQSRLDLTNAGSRAEQIQAGEAQVAQAKAQVQQLEVQIRKATLTSPVDGIVLERVINLGELAGPGNILVKLGSLAKVKLTIYVPEDQIGPLQLRQGVKVHTSVDSFPGRTFDGTITFIAPQAEFTPRNVQTKDERATTVFPVRIELANPDGALKPGMPADATITGATQ